MNLVGPGGVRKDVPVAGGRSEQMRGDFQAGVWFVGSAGVNEPHEIPSGGKSHRLAGIYRFFPYRRVAHLFEE